MNYFLFAKKNDIADILRELNCIDGILCMIIANHDGMIQGTYIQISTVVHSDYGLVKLIQTILKNKKNYRLLKALV